MKPKGVTFTSQRADDEQTSEFLASSDKLVSPDHDPDRAGWRALVADMYRYVIEHPEWIPKDWQKKLDLRAGHDKGRIYRIYPTDKKPRDIPRLDKMKVEELVATLESPNGWTRDTAHQCLVRVHSKNVNADDVIKSVANTALTVRIRKRGCMHSWCRKNSWDGAVRQC